MGDFLAYDASQWLYEATLVPVKTAVSGVIGKVRRGGVRHSVVLAALAFGVTDIERQLPPSQVVTAWESSHGYGASGNVVPIGYWSSMVNRVQRWPAVVGDAKMPDFDSLA